MAPIVSALLRNHRLRLHLLRLLHILRLLHRLILLRLLVALGLPIRRSIVDRLLHARLQRGVDVVLLEDTAKRSERDVSRFGRHVTFSSCCYVAQAEERNLASVRH